MGAVLSVELYGSASTFKFEFFSIFGRFLAFLAGVQNFKVTFLPGVLQAKFFLLPAMDRGLVG